MSANGVREARPLGRILLALVAIACGGEVFVRLFIGGPSPQVYDPAIGYAYLPYSEQFQAREGYARLRLNALGLNDADIGPRDGRCRVLVIGDSYTAALQVPREQNFTSVAEQLDKRLDVVNAGRDGLFLGDMHTVFDRLAGIVKPDLVVYVVSQRAVEADTVLPGLRIRVAPGTGQISDVVMQVEEKEVLKQIFAPVLRVSALATRLSAQIRPMVVDAMSEFSKWRERLLFPPGSGSDAAGRAPGGPTNEDILAFIFRRFAAKTPAALLYVNALQYHPSSRATVAPSSADAEAAARSAAARAGIRLFNTADYLIASMGNTGEPPYGFNNSMRPGGHLNEVGHRAVGRALVDLVRAMGPALPPECHLK
jgi:hypothetical protein